MSDEQSGGADERDAVWRRAEPDSPCVSICVVHPAAKLCVGCYRTVDEIAAWSQMTPEDRAAVREALPSRASRLRDDDVRPTRRRAARRRSAP